MAGKGQKVEVKIDKCPKCGNPHDLTVDLSTVLVNSLAPKTLVVMCPTKKEMFEVHGDLEN